MFSKNNDTIYKARYQTNEKGNMEDVVLTTLGNGTLLHYNYDGFSRLTGNSCGPLITERTYLEGANYTPTLKYTTNLVETYTNKIDAVVMQQYEYGYDDNSNITGITETEANETTTYTYDGLNRLIGEINPNNTYVYNYDVGGNLTTVTNNGLPVHSYTYGNSNWKDQLTSIDTNGITYDANGNPLTYDGYTFTWQRGRQLTAFTGNGQNISYTYDAQGHRIQQTVNGTTLTYTYSGDLLMRQSDGTNTLDFQYDANGIAAGFNYNGTPYFYMRNLQGDVVAIADADGTLVAEYTYDAWGNITAFSGAMASINPIRYRGYYQDPVTGWYFLQSRYYNPDWRRFLNADSLFVAGDAISGSNMYAYCNGNPVMYTDPSGMGIFDWIGDALDAASKWASSNYNKLHNKVSQMVSKKIGEEIMTPGADWFEENASPLIGGLMDSLYPNTSWPDRNYPFRNISILQLRTYFPRDMSKLAGIGATILDFHENVDWNSPNCGNYTTLPGNYQWQKGVGYVWWYDWFFNLGGPVGKQRYEFVVDQGTPNEINYIIWCWKGEYWNLGTGAEIGIYYNEDAEQAEQGYYKIDAENLFVTVLMNVFYDRPFFPFFGSEQITENLSQTSWWVTSFTPRIQRPDLEKLHVYLEVQFAPSTSYQHDDMTLWNSFYDEWNPDINDGTEQFLSWGPIIRLTDTNHNYCGQVPCECSDIGDICPCCKHPDNFYKINY